MRNTLILAVLCLALYSCNKEYTCECISDDKTDTTSNVTFQVNSVKERNARDKCASYQTQVNTSLSKKLVCTLHND